MGHHVIMKMALVFKDVMKVYMVARVSQVCTLLSSFQTKTKKKPMELAYFWSFLLSIFPVVLRLRVFQVYCPILCLLPFGHSHSYSTGITLT